MSIFSDYEAQTERAYHDMQEGAETPSDADMLAHLDAYGHLTWTVGNEDWLACFDFYIHDDRLAYHVVVDCESGGFTDTIEQGVIPLSDWGKLTNLPGPWCDICNEHYASNIDPDGRLFDENGVPDENGHCNASGAFIGCDPDSYKTAERWNEALRQAVEAELAAR